MKGILLSIFAIAPLMAGCAAATQHAAAPDTYGYRAIAARDYIAAEARLLREAAVHPKEPSVLLNLALVYAETGRGREAANLYRSALDQDNVLMDVPGSDQPGWSHDIAKKGLGRAPVMASR